MQNDQDKISDRSANPSGCNEVGARYRRKGAWSFRSKALFAGTFLSAVIALVYLVAKDAAK